MANPFAPDWLLGYSPATLRTHGLPAPTPEAGQRWQPTQARRKLMEGVWHYDLYSWAASEKNPALLRNMGNLDLSECLYLSVVDQTAVVYESEPTVSHAAGELTPAMAADCGALFGTHQRLNKCVLGHGEAAIVLDVLPRSAWDRTPTRIGASVAMADEIDAEPVAAGSRELAVFWRATSRQINGCRQKCWDYWDLTGAEPVYEVRLAGGAPVPELRLAGKEYLKVWQTEQGEPYIPAVLYHADRGHELWQPYRWTELARATLETAMSWSDWREAFKNASFALRYLLDAEVDDGSTDGEGEEAAETHVVAPNSLMKFRSRPSVQGAAGVLAAPIDVLKHAQALTLRHKVRAQAIGLHPSEIEQTGTPESGVALTIRREGQRHAQRQQEPSFRTGDLELLAKWSALRRTLGLPTLPDAGWSINYGQLAESASEAQARREQEQHDLDHSFTSRARILAARTRISVEHAAELAATIRAEQAAESGSVASFNSAQVTAALDVVRSVAASEIPRVSGVGMLVKFFGLAQEEAEALIGTAGLTTTAPTPGGEPSAAAVVQPVAPPPATGTALPLAPAPARPEEPEHPYAGRLDYQGLPILVETAAGETRSGVDPDGHAWSVTMPWHYGELEGTEGLDGDPLDVMVGPDAAAPEVFVLHLRVPGQEGADEDKAYLGFGSEEEALAAFRAAYSRTDILSGITRWTLLDFKAAALDPAKRGLRLDAPPGSGLPERAPDPAEMDAESIDDPMSET